MLYVCVYVYIDVYSTEFIYTGSYSQEARANAGPLIFRTIAAAVYVHAASIYIYSCRLYSTEIINEPFYEKIG